MTDSDAPQLVGDILDLLVDAPCPFSGLYRTLLRMARIVPRPPDVIGLWDAVCRLDDKKLIRLLGMAPDGALEALPISMRSAKCGEYAAWLPRADLEDLSVDTVGVWLELLPAGRDAWRSLMAAEAAAEPRWMLDVDLKEKTLTIHAESLEDVRIALEGWLHRMPQIRVVEQSIADQSGVEYIRGDGIRVRGGVRRTLRIEVDPTD